MIEAMMSFLGGELLAAQLTGKDEPRRGNRHPDRAPQGVYPCAGEDRWIAISITSDEEWAALCDEANLADAFRSMNHEARQQNHDAVDEALSNWSLSTDPVDSMNRLQAHGVIACLVADASDLVNDPQLEHDGFWAEVDHSEIGRRRYPGLPIHFEHTPATYRCGPPLLGEHNAEILSQILGYTAPEIEAFERDEIITDKPPIDPPVRNS
jgi:benzylsuccinate CoA-transferase BbsF subunit